MKIAALCMTLFLLLMSPLRAETDPADLKKMVDTLDAHPERVVELCQRYIRDPYATDARGLGSALIVYMTKSDKVHVHIHTGLFLPLLDKKDTASYSDILTIAVTLGLLGDAAQNGGTSGQTEASNVKALRAMAEAYTNMLKVYPDRTNQFAARIVAMSKKPGELEKYVTQALAEEKKNKTTEIPLK